MNLRLRPSFAALALVTSLSATVAAQPAAQPDPVTEVARQRYQDGVKAFDAGRFEEARAAFFQAYALKQHPAVLLNLGLSELRTNRITDAGNHLTQFLREHKDMTPEQRSTATQALEEAKRKAALVTIQVDQAGADVSVDGALVGKAPLNEPVFVEPGARTIVASFGGKNAMTRVEAKRGTTTTATVVLNAGAPPSPVAPVDPNAGQPVTQPPPAQPYAPVGPMGQPYAPQQPPPDEPSGRQPFFEWYADRPLAWVGTGVFVLGLGLGIGFSAAASSSSGAANDTATTIREEANNRGFNEPPCGPRDGGSDAAGFANACDTLRDQLDVYDTNVTVSVIGWVTAGLALGGTITYAIVDWYGAEPQRDARGQLRPRFEVAPLVGPVSGVGAVGTF